MLKRFILIFILLLSFNIYAQNNSESLKNSEIYINVGKYKEALDILKNLENLSNILHKLGATVEICKTPDDILHFKSECSALDDDVILVSSKMAQLDYLKSNYQLIELPIGEEGAANALRINDKLLLPDGFIKAEEMLSKKYNIIKIKVDEIAKVDAGLSCMSLRW